jgi:hypothetical protein
MKIIYGVLVRRSQEVLIEGWFLRQDFLHDGCDIRLLFKVEEITLFIAQEELERCISQVVSAAINRLQVRERNNFEDFEIDVSE